MKLLFRLLIALQCIQLAYAANLTTTNIVPATTNWNAAIWKTNGLGTAVSPAAGNTYEMIFNGVSIGN